MCFWYGSTACRSTAVQYPSGAAGIYPNAYHAWSMILNAILGYSCQNRQATPNSDAQYRSQFVRNVQCSCACVRVRACVRACVRGCVCVCVCMYVWLFVGMHPRMYACMYVCMYVWMYGCTYVCTYVMRQEWRVHESNSTRRSVWTGVLWDTIGLQGSSA